VIEAIVIHAQRAAIAIEVSPDFDGFLYWVSDLKLDHESVEDIRSLCSCVQ